MNGTRDSVFKRCGCTDPNTGRQLAGHCPHLADPEHPMKRRRGRGRWRGGCGTGSRWPSRTCGPLREGGMWRAGRA